MNILDEYFESLLKQNIAPQTASSYRRDVENYKLYLGRRWEKTILKATANTVNEYLDTLREDGKAESTIHRYLVSLRSLYRYLEEQDKIKMNPTADLELGALPRKFPSALSLEEVELLLEQPQQTSLKGYRDKALLELLYATGMRVSELVGLNVDRVNLSAGSVICEGEKRSRFIPMGKTAARAVGDYLRVARPLMVKEDKEKALFVSCNGARLTRQGFWKLIKVYAEKAGIRTDITPHTLRHSFAIHLVENGADIGIVQEMLGNSDAAYTRIYMEVKESKIAEAYQKAHPRA